MVLCNYSEEVTVLPNMTKYNSGDILLSNYSKLSHDLSELQPYEAIVIELEN